MFNSIIPNLTLTITVEQFAKAKLLEYQICLCISSQLRKMDDN